MWEAISGFRSPGEYSRFVAFIESQVSTGVAEELPPDPSYEAGHVYGGRWFRDRSSGAVWRLVPPDIPFQGLWEPVSRGGQTSRSRAASADLPR